MTIEKRERAGLATDAHPEPYSARNIQPHHTTPTIERILRRLPGAERTATGWLGDCPVCGEPDAMAFGHYPHGGITIKLHCGCRLLPAMVALGLDVHDLLGTRPLTVLELRDTHPPTAPAVGQAPQTKPASATQPRAVRPNQAKPAGYVPFEVRGGKVIQR